MNAAERVRRTLEATMQSAAEHDPRESVFQQLLGLDAEGSASFERALRDGAAMSTETGEDPCDLAVAFFGMGLVFGMSWAGADELRRMTDG